MAYWLETGNFPPIYHEKYQKTIWLIDDEDIANRCKTWIRAQNDRIILKTFKDFIKNTLLIRMGITKKKSISLTTTIRWLNILRFFYQQYC